MKILFDCDPGLDDAVALLAAISSPRFDIQAITTVAGNVAGTQTALNARIIRTITEAKHIPIHKGADRPLNREPVTAEDFHGTTGLGGIDVPAPNGPLSDTQGIHAIIQYANDAKEAPITFVQTGPMTNLATAIAINPAIVEGISEIVMMAGGSQTAGNITPYAEFNVFADPHAADIVFNCGVPIRCLSLDVTHDIRTTKERIKLIKSVGTKAANYAAKFLEASCGLELKAAGHPAAPLHDPSTIIALAEPNLFQGKHAHVSVVKTQGEMFGHTEVAFAENGPVLWYQTADVDGVYETLYGLLGGKI
ncbi:MAG: nucleoside hydrolase [Pseudomonadota bacterium]